MRLSLAFVRDPTPGLDRAHDGLPSGIHRDVLHCYPLLPSRAVAPQSFHLGREGPCEVITQACNGVGQVLMVVRMVANMPAPVVRRAVSTTVRMAASPWAAHRAR
jgi:hypothetical protein